MVWQTSNALLVQALGRDRPRHTGMGWDPSPDPPALLFCVATQSWRWGRQWQSPWLGQQAALVPPAVPGTPCSPTRPQSWPVALPRAAEAAGVLRALALHSQGSAVSQGTAAAGGRGGIQCPLFAVVPKAPLSCSMWWYRAGHWHPGSHSKAAQGLGAVLKSWNKWYDRTQSRGFLWMLAPGDIWPQLWAWV